MNKFVHIDLTEGSAEGTIVDIDEKENEIVLDEENTIKSIKGDDVQKVYLKLKPFKPAF